MSLYTTVLTCGLWGINANDALAATDKGWSLSLQGGGSVGTVSIPEQETDEVSQSEKTITLGGFPLIVNATIDSSNHLAFAAGGSLLFDIPNSQVSQQSIHSAIHWHLLGGARELIAGEPTKDFYIVSRTTKQLSLVLQGVLIRYAASSKNLKTKITGSTFEIRSGLRFRYDFGLLNAGGMEILGTLLSIPADEERLKSQTIEFSFFWQI